MKNHHWVWIVVFVWFFFGYMLAYQWVKGSSVPGKFLIAATWPYWVFLAGQAPPPTTAQQPTGLRGDLPVVDPIPPTLGGMS